MKDRVRHGLFYPIPTIPTITNKIPMKPERVITIVHTGTGNNGKTNIGKDRVHKFDLQIQYVGALDSCQSYCYKDSVFENEQSEIIDSLQDIFFVLGALAHNGKNEKYIDKIKEDYELMKFNLDNLLHSSPLEPLQGFIKTNRHNAVLMQLRCEIRRAERIATSLTAKGKLDIIHVHTLNLLSDVVFALIWRYCVKNNCLEVWAG